ncbi:DNA cytosine-5-methyltransferase [Fusarium longipes]|uniref:DNA (cytosine-5-)-methyltransferase n=1 Tax=Fusarium longipes TaxID=694270 RepID=A0A395S6X6_9HYPO|nr:DNA cytosine-5-methyltransferase [Fusarium longipes]
MFENAFAPQEPQTSISHGTPKMWTKFGEMEEEQDRMSVLEQVDLSSISPDPNPSNYDSGPEDLFGGIDVEILDTTEPEVTAGGDFGLEFDEAGATAESLQQEDGTTIKVDTPDLPWSRTVRVELPDALFLIPRSFYEPFEPGVAIDKEYKVVAQLLEAAKQKGQDTDDFVEFELNEFAVYCERQRYEQEMCSLHHLDTKTGHSNFFFDGKLSVGDAAFFVRHVPIRALPIGDYGTLTKHTVRDQIWVQSAINSKKNIYYRLNRPAKEYRRFFDPFLWVADLAKHFVDYLKMMGESKRDVTIFHFRANFSNWLAKTHKTEPVFVSWREQHPSVDFRTSIVANLAFLHKEAIGVLDYAGTYQHTLWAEIWEFRRYERFPKIEKSSEACPKTSKSTSRAASPAEQVTCDQGKNTKGVLPTIVTQYIYDCFDHLPFGDRLEVMPLSDETTLLRNDLIRKRHLELPAPLHRNAKNVSTAARQRIRDIRPGDTISTQRDGEDSGTQWRRDVSHGFSDVDRWLALVQRVHINKGVRLFDVIWYYRPVDTLCALMKYPWNNELFLSDHCSCAEQSKISEDEIMGVHEVEFGGTSATDAEFFCRQTYVVAEQKWIILERDHLHCSHKRKTPRTPLYQPGETRLVMLDKASGRSEPCEFVTSYEEDGAGIYRFRRLLRRHQVDPQAPDARPNELVYSENLIEVKNRRILEPCYVRFFKAQENIPTPYDRDGVGNFFYITHEEVIDEGTDVKSYLSLGAPPPSLREGYDPFKPLQKLRGLDLFCGGGNFGRGLEDGGGIEMRWANDYDEKALHTYMANTSVPDKVHPFLGSIDDMQRFAIEGKFMENVPPIGDVDFISGGSPCPGFSLLTNDKTTLAQRKNQSLVAAFGSFVDLYRPRYGLLENVPGIIHSKSNRDQDVFSQLICAIVGLGYQTQFFFLDASSCGSPQRRSRVFLAFAAPGHRLPQRPHITHAHPQHTKNYGLGSTPTGEPMAERIMPVATPFDYVSARAATASLPPVYDSKPDICVPYPDHRVSIGMTANLRNKINLIPTRPWGMNFAQAWFGLDCKKAGSGVLTPAERLVFPEEGKTSLNRAVPSSKAYGRQRPDRLIETIVTGQSPSDAKNGRTLHWSENRVLTIMEARRAQGFRDHEVLLGNPSDQWKIVGNSVAREVAVSLGSVFREAWAQSLVDEHHAESDISVVPALNKSSETPARMGIEVTPSVNVGELARKSTSFANKVSRSRRSRSRSRKSQPTSTPSPAPSESKSSKRNLVAIETRISKSPKSRKDDSPSRSTSATGSRVRLSRLRHDTTNA